MSSYIPEDEPNIKNGADREMRLEDHLEQLGKMIEVIKNNLNIPNLERTKEAVPVESNKVAVYSHFVLKMIEDMEVINRVTSKL